MGGRIGGGIVGAVMVHAVKGGDINFIKPAYAQLTPSFLNCYLKKMEDVHVDMSADLLQAYGSRTKFFTSNYKCNPAPW